MRILYLDVDSLGAPYSGGQAKRTFEVARRIARHHDVHVLTAGHPSLARRETIDGVAYERMLPLPTGANFLWYFLEAVPRGLTTDADLIVESFSVPLTATLLFRFSKRPVIGVSNFLFAKYLAAKYHVPFDAWENLMLKPVRYAIALTKAQRDHIVKRAPNADVTLIPNGADTSAMDFRWSGRGGYVAFMGRIEFFQKGIEYLLNAAAQFPPGIELRIAGAGPDTSRLHDAITTRGLDRRVQYVGRLAGDERHRFLADACMLAFPSRYEGQSLVLLDALTIGVPIVAFGIPENVEVLEGISPLVTPFDEAEFARAIIAMVNNPELQELTSEAERKASARYQWDTIAAQEMEYYERVMTIERSRRT
ncbi:MAG: glycosyltransferase family 4 protein [Candidatus Eremiobacteraeota bacterium]|nr:glycosyltransferase family 4 protein [Candidatus Eremiobacteraeota bacterium]